MKSMRSRDLRLMFIVLLILLALFVAGCASISTGAHYDETTDFGRYLSFSWLDEEPLIVGEEETGIVISPLTKAKVQKALQEGFERKGYRFFDDPDQADFVVAYTIGTRQELSVRSYPDAYHGKWGWHVRGSRYYINEYQTHHYTKGTLGVDVFDRATKKPIWHGFAEKTITSTDKHDPMIAIEAGVRGMLESFPK